MELALTIRNLGNVNTEHHLIASTALIVAGIGVGITADVGVTPRSIHNLVPHKATEILNFIVAFVRRLQLLLLPRQLFQWKEKLRLLNDADATLLFVFFF